MRRRQSSTRSVPRGSARNLRQAAIMKNLAEITIANQAEACNTGAQNIEDKEKITANSGTVTRAESSLRTNIANSSYSNSGRRPLAGVRRARSWLRCRLTRPGRSSACAASVVELLVCAVGIVSLAKLADANAGKRRAWGGRSVDLQSRQIPNVPFINILGCLVTAPLKLHWASRG